MMNIETGTGTGSISGVKQTEQSQTSTTYSKSEKDFKSEMESLKNNQSTVVEEANEQEETSVVDNSTSTDESTQTAIDNNLEEEENTVISDEKENNTEEELTSTIEQINNSLNQTDDFKENELNPTHNQPDINNITSEKNKELNNQLLNNDMNLQNVKNDKMQELKADISFAQNSNEAFSSFFNNNNLSETEDEIQEDSTVLSTMAENIAMVNRVLTAQTASVTNEIGNVGKVGEVVDIALNALTLNMTRADVQFFINLATGETNNITAAEETSGSSMVSETLANLLADSMKNNKAFRINFDNDISVIIKLSKEGRISANFIPGSDIAENYLRNNLSNLVQRFEEEDIPYDDLTHQGQRRNSEQEQNKKDKNNNE